MIVKIEDIEIRGHEVKQSKAGKYAGRDYMIVRFEDPTGKAHEIVDRDMDNEPHYKRGTTGHIYADLTMGKDRQGNEYARLEVSRFEADKGAAKK